MSKPKMLLPWAGRAIVAHVIEQVISAGASDILVIVGGHAENVVRIAAQYPVQTVINPSYLTGEMLSSIQAGLRAAGPSVEAAVVLLGDQPQIQVRTIEKLLQQFSAKRSGLIVPSYNQRRGHPWLIDRGYWQEILNMKPGQTMRDFFILHANEIDYFMVDDSSVLKDVDTPEDYLREKPETHLEVLRPDVSRKENQIDQHTDEVWIWSLHDGERRVIFLPERTQTLDQATRQLPVGAYTTFRTFDRWNALHLEDHLDRLAETACLTGRDIQIDHSQVRDHLRDALHEINLADARCRLVLDTTERPGELYLLVEHLVTPSPELYGRGVRLITRPMQRDNPRAKQTNFINQSARMRAEMPDGVFEVLMVDPDGRILEGLTSNFFTICEGTLWTAEEHVLAGITRSIVLSEAKKLGLEIVLEPIPLDQLKTCTEAFLTSSSRGVLPVRQVDDVVIGSGLPGLHTTELSKRYEARVRQEAQPI